MAGVTDMTSVTANSTGMTDMAGVTANSTGMTDMTGVTDSIGMTDSIASSDAELASVISLIFSAGLESVLRHLKSGSVEHPSNLSAFQSFWGSSGTFSSTMNI